MSTHLDPTQLTPVERLSEIASLLTGGLRTLRDRRFRPCPMGGHRASPDSWPWRIATLLLAPDIQEAILFLPRVAQGRDPILLRHLQPVALTPSWHEQRELWKTLRAG